LCGFYPHFINTEFLSKIEYLVYFLLDLVAQVDAYLKNIGATRSSNFTIRDSSMLIELNLTSKNSMFRNAEKAQGYAHLTYKISRKMIRINQKTGWILHFVFGKGKKSTAFLRRQQSTLDR